MTTRRFFSRFAVVAVARRSLRACTRQRPDRTASAWLQHCWSREVGQDTGFVYSGWLENSRPTSARQACRWAAAATVPRLFRIPAHSIQGPSCELPRANGSRSPPAHGVYLELTGQERSTSGGIIAVRRLVDPDQSKSITWGQRRLPSFSKWEVDGNEQLD
jgi:hypothetical protein